MFKKTITACATILFAVLITLVSMHNIAVAQKSAVPKPQDTLALGEDEVKDLLLLIDTGKTGKISKQDWMNFMEAEFDRLDKNKSGELDAKELVHSRLRVSPFTKVGK